MSSTAGRVFTGLKRIAFGRGIFVFNSTPTAGLSSVRPLVLSSQRSAQSKDGDKKVDTGPIKFSTSKASHRTWKVDRSMGSQFERPWWKVLPISLLLCSLILWCTLRDQADIDAQLNKDLYEHLPGLLPDEDEEQDENK